MENNRPLFDKTEFKKQMSKIYEMETESDKKAHQKRLQQQAEKEMKLIKAELLMLASSKQRPPTASVLNEDPITKAEFRQPPPSIFAEFYDYLVSKKL